MNKGYVGLMLHAHLPFVRHPEYPRFLEEDWLFEAITETYLPLLRKLNSLKNDNISFTITISVSPTLVTMLADPLLKKRYVQYLEQHIELGKKEAERTSDDKDFNELSLMYYELYKRALFDYTNVYRQDLIAALRDLETSGHLEIITTCATHAFLPLYQEYPEAIKAQIELALLTHVSHFRKKPKGIWLPECGYFPGLEKFLKVHDINYFFTSSHGVLLASEKAERGVYAPITCPNGIHAFGRSFEISQAVWSEEDGYPADYEYRDFYRDIGYDLDLDYIRPYIHEPDVRVFTGYKYWAITGKTDKKRVYNPQKAEKRVSAHAGNFLYMLERTNQRAGKLIDRPPYYTVPFDAELFGHWWFEGIDWLDKVIRGIAEKEHLSMVSQTQYINEFPGNQKIQPALSSWGNKGYAAVWLDGSNDWIYRHIHKSIERMIELANRFPNQTSLKKRFLDHAAREVLLAMASDWPFIINNGTTMTYAERRLREHIHNFNVVYDNLCRNTVDTEWLTKTEKKYTIFPDIDYQMFTSIKTKNKEV
ncbi:MAG: DUF1957 domain-containing protein [Spirochaetia bacterium]|nr:DUF1957 domain-containing protein [Spirochaetia bacterium]MCF7946455.1 DUF1957 domain-containing protein [Spirochaetia bacterium]